MLAIDPQRLHLLSPNESLCRNTRVAKLVEVEPRDLGCGRAGRDGQASPIGFDNVPIDARAMLAH
jgi:hypothetical protein